MEGTFDTNVVEASNHTDGHSADIQPLVRRDCPNRYPSEGYYASIRDMAKLVAFLTRGAGDALSPASREAMLSRRAVHYYSDCFSFYGGEGWEPEPGETSLFLGSGSEGHSAEIDILEERGLAWVFLVNQYGFDPVPLNKAITKIYEPGAPPNWRYDYVASTETLASTAGTYRDDVGFGSIASRTVRLGLFGGTLGGQIEAEDEPPGPFVLTPDHSVDSYQMTLAPYSDPPFAGVRIWRNEAGRADAMQLLGDFGPPFFRVEEEEPAAP